MIEETLPTLSDTPAEAPRGSRGVRLLVVAIVVLASLTTLVGGVALYAREEVVNRAAFADRAVDAMQRPAVQQMVAREITVQLLEPALPDAIAARPVVESAVRLVVGSKPFAGIIRLAAEHGQRLLFERHGGNAVFQISDAGAVVFSALRTLAPRIARDIPARAEAVLLTLRRRSFAGETLRFADIVSVLGLVLPAAALLLFAAAIAVARDRRRAITQSAIGVGVVTVGFAIALEFARRYVLSHVYGTYEVTNADVRAAVGDVWDAYAGDLLTWTVVVTAVAWLVAAQSASLLPAYSPAAGLRLLRHAAGQRLPKRFRAVRGAAILAAGVFVLVQPSLALRIVAVLGGGVIVYVGAGELLLATAPAQRPARRLRRPSSRLAFALGASAVASAAAIAAASALTGARASAAPGFTCNGYAQLCDRRLDEVVFAGTHNAMSAADSPGWLIANQDRDVAQQLQDGIRAFKISTHYAVKSSAGSVHTDIAASGARLNRVAKKLPPDARATLQRLSFSLNRGSIAGAKRDVWLCHSLCELGATRMVDFLATIRRFLELNPNQVIILFDEDYVAERDLRGAFKRAGLLHRLATLQPGQPLPTLRELIRSGHNIVVFAQKRTSGRYSWDPYAFSSWVQDTPLGAVKPGQFSCKLYRGSAQNPLLMMNDWADIFPPRPTANLPLVKEPFILARARQCTEQRGKMPNIILTDYYNRGDVIGAVNALNDVQGQPAKTTAVSPIR